MQITKQENHTFIKWVIGLIMMVFLTPSVHSASYLMITDLGSSAEMIRRGNIEGFSVGSNAILKTRHHFIMSICYQHQYLLLNHERSQCNLSVAIDSGVGVFGMVIWTQASMIFLKHE